MFAFEEPENASFPRAHCPSCDKEVLVYRDLSEGNSLQSHCVDCDTVTADPMDQTWSRTELEGAGYQLETTVPEGGGCGDGRCSH